MCVFVCTYEILSKPCVGVFIRVFLSRTLKELFLDSMGQLCLFALPPELAWRNDTFSFSTGCS